jgi:hypothetical protein
VAAHAAKLATGRFYFALTHALARHLTVAYKVRLSPLPRACFRSRSARDCLALLLLTRRTRRCADRWEGGLLTAMRSVFETGQCAVAAACDAVTRKLDFRPKRPDPAAHKGADVTT